MDKIENKYRKLKKLIREEQTKETVDRLYETFTSSKDIQKEWKRNSKKSKETVKTLNKTFKPILNN